MEWQQYNSSDELSETCSDYSNLNPLSDGSSLDLRTRSGCHKDPGGLTHVIDEKYDVEHKNSEEEFIVFGTNARVQIYAMMIEILSASSTSFAMVASLMNEGLAEVAIGSSPHVVFELG